MWSYLLAAVGILGIWLAGRKSAWGWAVGLGAQLLWIVYALVTIQYGFILSALASIDPDGLARVIEEADDALLAAGQVPATYLHPEACQCIAATVKAWLVGEES